MTVIAEPFAQTAQFSQRYGMEDICRYHTRYCTGELQQYTNETECLDYMRALPMYTELCGAQRAFYGHSLPCKWKHHILVPANPSVHCGHIGKEGARGGDDSLKCDDVAECTEDEGQDDWPAFVLFGDNTPPERIALYEADNVGYEDEPFPCVIPLE